MMRKSSTNLLPLSLMSPNSIAVMHFVHSKRNGPIQFRDRLQIKPTSLIILFTVVSSSIQPHVPSSPLYMSAPRVTQVDAMKSIQCLSFCSHPFPGAARPRKKLIMIHLITVTLDLMTNM
ncbi:hypothetical protein BDZ91DRAFT_718094 [Kalaharituber pfeilii]|nr:hypothetical protein BDZ91DRAFT_718094 [Kalaharituber pfeilii]